MTGSGNSGLNLNAHEDDKKSFYGLMKKKTLSEESQELEAQAERASAPEPAAQPPAGNLSQGLYSARQASRQAPAVVEDAPQPEPAPAPVAASPRAAAPRAEAEEPEELKKILTKSATYSPPEAMPQAAEPGPGPQAEKDDRLISSSEIDTLRHNKSEEDILNEFNQIISKSHGADLAEKPEEELPEKKKSKDKVKPRKKLRQKVTFEAYDPEKHGAMATFPGLAGYDEIERYWVIEPYSFVVILYNEQANTYLYYVSEPSLTVFEKELLEDVYQRLQDMLLLDDIDVKADKKDVLVQKTTEIIVDYIGKIDAKSYHKIIYYIVRDYLEFGKITPIMHDNFIEDISNNGFDTPIFLYHKNYENIMTNITFNEKQLDSFVIRLAQRCGKHISIAEPMIDATMPDGSRIQMTLGKEITTRGSTFTIRKFKEIPITPIDLIAWNTFSSETMAYLWLCIENNKSLIFSGGTASGKTSSLNAVALFIPPKAKVISLEDTRELKLPHQNWIPGLTRDSFTADGKGSIEMFALLKAALRQRPEYLLVGEVRGKEALTLFQAMSTGHTTFSTMHADSVESAIHRLENPPISVPRTMITALDIISIQSQTYLKNKRVRRNMKLVEIHDIDPNTRNIRTNDVYVWNSGTDRFDRVGESRIITEIAQRRAWGKKEIQGELTRRQRVLEYMVKNNIRDFHQVAAIIQAYLVKPDRVVEKLMIKE